MNEIQKQGLRTYEQMLNNKGRRLLHICALLQEPTSRSSLLKLLHMTRDPDWIKVQKVSEMDSLIHKLQAQRFLDEDLTCVRSMQELVARKAALEDGFLETVSFISQEWPAHRDPTWNHLHGYKVLRVLRDLRLALLSHDYDTLQSIYDLLQSRFGQNPEFTNPFWPIIANPFEPTWMQSLPLPVQALALADVLAFNVCTAEVDDNILHYAQHLQLTQEVPAKIRNTFRSSLVKLHLMSLDHEKAHQVHTQITDDIERYKLQGWMSFLQGQPQAAVSAFDLAMHSLGRQQKIHDIFLQDDSGVIYALSLFSLQDAGSLKRLNSLLRQALSQKNTSNFWTPVYRALNAVQKAKNMYRDQARQSIPDPVDSSGLLQSWMIYLARYWVYASLSDTDKLSLQKELRQALNSKMNWLVLEIGALLEKTDKSAMSHSQLKAVQDLAQKCDLQPMVEVYRPAEPWQQTLEALQKIAHPSDDQHKICSDHRLVWLVEPRAGPTIDLQPKLQKKTSGGQWTRGRNVALDKLIHWSQDMDFATQEDRRLLTALQNYSSPFQGSWNDFDPHMILPLLVGHPRLFLQSDPSVHVELLSSEPELSVVRSGNGYVLSITPDPGKSSIQLIQETETRFKVVQISQEHRRIAAILGSSSFSVPESGYEQLARTVSSLSGLVTVHSDIQSRSEDAREVETDSRPCLLITPVGNGFRVNMVIRPLGESGPSLKPGTGQSTLIAEIQGQRMQTTRNLEEEKLRAQAVENVCPSLSGFDCEDRIWTVPDPEDCLYMLFELKKMQDQDQVQVLWPEGEKLAVSNHLSVDDLYVSLGSKRDWFELSGHLHVDQDTVLELQSLLRHGPTPTFVPLDETRYAILSRGLRRRLLEIGQLAEKKGSSLKMPGSSVFFLEGLEQEVGELSTDQAWVERRQAIHEAARHHPSPPSTLKAELRDYQIVGYQWLSRLAKMGFGACLADDMGLGKTLQALALLVERAPQGPSLVVAPTSVGSNWISEAKRFAPTLVPTLYEGKERQELLEHIGPFDLLICSYALLMQDAETLCRISWDTVVLDEAQAIKNWSTKRTQAAMQLQADFRIVTTGTPLENNVQELWTLFRFLNPGLLGTRKRFQERFVTPIQKEEDQEKKRVLKKIIQPFILRRLKSQVMEELPARTEVTLKVHLGQEEAALYEAMRRQAVQNVQNIEDQPGPKHLRILAELTKLRQMCCHPRLVFPDTELGSSKLAVLEDLISELVLNGHKALIFSQFVKNLHLVQDLLQNKGVQYRYLDGSTPNQIRDQEISAFQAGQGDVFLISLKAGGTGINLTAADYVIHLDPWWNPAVEDQAADRAHRIGQKRPVTVYRLVTENTVEEKILRLHFEKRDLADSLLEGSDVSHKVDAKELMQLLQQGAEG